MKTIYLFPGHLACSKEPAEITTVLGSCVGVALFDPHLKIGGLNHYLLPYVLPGEPASEKYGEYALFALIEEMEKLGARRERLVSKVFGGANVLTGVDIGMEVGTKNIEVAFTLLGKLGIPILQYHTGGINGRKILLNTETFEVTHWLQNRGK